MLINDFAAAGYGVLNLKEMDYTKLNDAFEVDTAVKAVIGPGTGLGQCFLTKSEFAPYYEINPAEGGHSEYSPRSKEDYELLEFAKNFIENSENIENQRAKGKIDRVSIERMCAGPAVPLIYDFMRNRHPDMERVLEKDGVEFNAIDSKMIINCGVIQKDPLCMKVVEKFTELFAVETGNLALKTLPFGGIYLIGGVTTGISNYLIHSDTFIKNFYMKGRMGEKMRKFPIYLVREETNVGMLGAEECAFRVMRKMRGMCKSECEGGMCHTEI